jgi:hypothetical protein
VIVYDLPPELQLVIWRALMTIQLQENNRMTIEKERALVLQHARALGCTCQPDIQLAKDGDTIRVTVAHDHDCAIVHDDTAA